MYKYFTRSFERPNRDLLTAVSAYEEVDVDEVAETLSVLKYKYITTPTAVITNRRKLYSFVESSRHLKEIAQ